MENVVTVLSGWKGRRVFLTGHTGFKGAWLSLLLHRLGAEVHGFALPPVARGTFSSAYVESTLTESTIGDVRDLSAVNDALERSGAEVIVHMAAQPLVRLSYREPVETYATNVMGTVHVLEAMRRLPHVRACVVVTSDKCYENREWPWGYRENEAMGGHDPYSNSKGCAELVASAYRNSYAAERDVRVASARAGNVIGGGDWSEDRLVPDLIRSFSAGQETSIRNPDAIRPWQHVLDPVYGYLVLADYLLREDGQAFAEGWNFGPDSTAERTVKDVVEAVCQEWGPNAAWSLDDGPKPHEAHFLKLDSSKARRTLGWHPRLDFDDAIAATVSWYREEQDGQDMLMKSMDQIETYLGLTQAAARASL